MSDKGIVYVVTHYEKCLREAEMSAGTVRRFCRDIPIALFTDLAHASISRYFDVVIPFSVLPEYKVRWRSVAAAHFVSRIRCLSTSPFENTLYLDSDTYILDHEITHIFDILTHADIALAECSDEFSFSRKKVGRPMLNCGVMLFRRDKLVMRLFVEWERITIQHFDFAVASHMPDVDLVRHIADTQTKRRLLFNDQLSFVRLLSPDTNSIGVKLAVLENRWNYTGRVDIDNVPAVIYHGRNAAIARQ